jgi:HK97 family phage portal protein
MGILRSLRAHPANPTKSVLYALGGGNQTYTGKQIDETTAMNYTAVFACIRVLAETLASLPLFLYKRLNPKGKEKATYHPLYRLLHTAPNPEMPSMIFREVMMVHLSAWGNFYGSLAFDGTGRVAQIWPLRPDKMTVHRNGDRGLKYKYTLPSGVPKTIDRRFILHIPAMGFDGVRGYSPITKAREAIGLGMATEEFGSRFFGNGARPGSVLEHPGTLSDKAQTNLRNSWEATHGGLSNSHKVAILEEGMTLKEIGIPPEDAQFLETRKFQLNEIARIFRVPPHKIGDLERATFSNVEQQSIDFTTDSITPWATRIEQCIGFKLLTEEEQAQYFVEHAIQGLLRGDIHSRYAAYAVGRQWGWLSANDIRELENQNPIDDGGDLYLTPMNMVPSDMVSGGQFPLKAESSMPLLQDARGKFPTNRHILKTNFHRLFRETSKRFVNRESIALKRAVEKHITKRNLGGFEKWMEDFYSDLPRYIKNSFLPVLRTYIEEVQREAFGEIGEEPAMTPELEAFVVEYMDRYTQRHIDSSLGQLNQIIRDTPPEALSEALTQRADDWAEKRPDKIAFNETSRASNGVATMIFLATGFRLVWRTVGPDTCPYCRALEGKTIGVGQSFMPSNTDWQPDGADSPMKITTVRKHPPLHYKCDCMAAAV